MRKILVFLPIIITLLFCGCTPNEEITVATVESDSYHEKNQCFGILIGDIGILTVAHIIPDEYESADIRLTCHIDGETYHSELIGIDRSLDLALLSCEIAANMIVFDSFTNHLYIKNNACFLKSTDNSLVSSDLKNKPERLIKMAVSIKGGDSGSPVLTPRGRLAGMVCARSPDGAYTYAIPSDVIAMFLGQYRNSTERHKVP